MEIILQQSDESLKYQSNRIRKKSWIEKLFWNEMILAFGSRKEEVKGVKEERELEIGSSGEGDTISKTENGEGRISWRGKT